MGLHLKVAKLTKSWEIYEIQARRTQMYGLNKPRTIRVL